MELTQKQREALLLWKQGKKNKEIAKKLGKSPSSAYYAITSGKKKLESILKTIEWAGKRKILDRGQVKRLSKILERAKNP